MPAGRPPLFETAELMQEAINKYLEDKKLSGSPTMSGLALYLGFESRQSLYDYEEKAEFTYTVKRARLHIEVHYEEKLMTVSAGGAIFALKNFGWADKQEITSKNYNINSDMSKEEIKSIAKDLEDSV